MNYCIFEFFRIFRNSMFWCKLVLQMPNSVSKIFLEVVERQRVAKERAMQGVRCWTVQNEMRDVLGQMFAGGA